MFYNNRPWFKKYIHVPTEKYLFSRKCIFSDFIDRMDILHKHLFADFRLI